MAQQNEQNHYPDPATVPANRKRGRPRKEDGPGTEPRGRTQRRRRKPPSTTTSQDLVGQPVSGILDGVFDVGFLITVRVSNNGPVLKGMVFDSRLSVPISAANDVAPHIKMSKRDVIPFPSAPISAEPLQRREPSILPRIGNRVLFNDGSEGSALRSKSSEAAISGIQLTVPKGSPVSVKAADYPRQELPGAPKLDSTAKTYPSANSERVQEIKTNPVGDGSIQMPSSGAVFSQLRDDDK